ncbi:hypothetical protein CCP3SC1AL1_630018 [Gammaproteobacteria bacterium]
MTTPELIKPDIELFWYDDVNVLIDANKLIKFFPTKAQTDIERLNSIMRFGMIVSIVLTMYHNDPRYLLLSLIGAIITYTVFSINRDQIEHTTEHMTSHMKINSKDLSKELSKNKVNTAPTLNNPFMNHSIFDIIENPDKPPASFYADNTESSHKTQEDIEDKFNYNLFKDVEQVYDKMNSQRQFYTMPSTTNPDNRETLQKWLYGDMPSYKDNTYDAKIHEDLRHNVPPYDYTKGNPVGN